MYLLNKKAGAVRLIMFFAMFAVFTIYSNQTFAQGAPAKIELKVRGFRATGDPLAAGGAPKSDPKPTAVSSKKTTPATSKAPVKAKKTLSRPDVKLKTPDESESKTISGGIINIKGDLVRPEYPGAARAVGATGAVNVQVLIDENGDVVSATAISGHPLLKQAAENAALQTQFEPFTLKGQPVKVSGVIVYNFQK